MLQGWSLGSVRCARSLAPTGPATVERKARARMAALQTLDFLMWLSYVTWEERTWSQNEDSSTNSWKRFFFFFKISQFCIQSMSLPGVNHLRYLNPALHAATISVEDQAFSRSHPDPCSAAETYSSSITNCTVWQSQSTGTIISPPSSLPQKYSAVMFWKLILVHILQTHDSYDLLHILAQRLLWNPSAFVRHSRLLVFSN